MRLIKKTRTVVRVSDRRKTPVLLNAKQGFFYGLEPRFFGSGGCSLYGYAGYVRNNLYMPHCIPVFLSDFTAHMGHTCFTIQFPGRRLPGRISIMDLSVPLV